MIESELCALLDAHDALVKACVEGGLPFAEFVLAYGDFPGGYGLEDPGASQEGQRMMERAGARLAFHRQVADLLSSRAKSDALPVGLSSGA